MSQTSNVEYLLENFTVADILDIQKKLKYDIEKRKEDVKELVNERYRELIEAADSIQEMRQKCAETINSVGNLEQPYCASNKTTTISNQVLEYAKKAKLIKDTSLRLWKLLEKGDFLDALSLKTGSLRLCKLMLESKDHDKDIPDVKPLLSKVLPTIESFDKTIENRCWRFLSESSGRDNYGQQTEALICIEIIKNLSAAETAQEYLRFMSIEALEELEVRNSNCLDAALVKFFEVTLGAMKTVYNLFMQLGVTPPLYSRTVKEIHRRNGLVMKLDDIPKAIDGKIFKLDLSRLGSNSDVSKEHLSASAISFLDNLKMSFHISFEKLLSKLSDITTIVSALQRVSDYHRNMKYPTWDNMCESVATKAYPAWETFLKTPILSRIHSVLDEKLQGCFDKIDIANCLSIQPEAMDQLLWGTSYSDELLRAKSYALPTASVTCLATYADEMDNLRSDVESFFNADIFIVGVGDVDSVKVSLIEKVNERLEWSNYHLRQLLEMENLPKRMLAIAQLCRSLVYSCPSLKSFLDLTANTSSDAKSALGPSLQKLLDCSHEALISYYTSFIEFQCSSFDDALRSQSLTEYYENILTWEEIVLDEGTGEDGKVISSTIRIPLQMSLHLHRLLLSASQGVNETSGHTSAHRVISHIWHTLSTHVSASYQAYREELKQSATYPASLKQNIALQCHFDVICFKQLLVTTRDESLRIEQIPSLAALASSYEEFIDPFDLHVFSPYLQTNLVKAGRGLLLLLGLLLPNNVPGDSRAGKEKAKTGKELHNLLNAKAMPAIPLLPVSRQKLGVGQTGANRIGTR